MGAVHHVTREPIDTAALVAGLARPGDGAVATFVGVVRDHHGGRPVSRLEYHAYEAMAAPELERIAAELRRDHPVSDLALVHRIGTLDVGEASVLVAVAAPHRRAALDACAAGIEAIKQRLPIWKKEFYADGSEPAWVYAPGERHD